MPRKKEFGEQWWSKRWLEVLEAMGWASRLQRGRGYARRGNVLSMQVRPGKVEARVQGSRPSPYKVAIAVRTLSDAQWGKAIKGLSSQASFAARLLAEEMPPNIEEAFSAVGVPLLPELPSDLKTSCSCPDWANPCKHIAAVHYLLGREFDADPFLIFKLRGRTREEVLEALRRERAGQGEKEETQKMGQRDPAPVTSSTVQEHLPLDPQAFWNGGPGLEAISFRMEPPPIAGTLLRQLGSPPPPLPPDTKAFLRNIYTVVSERALKIARDEEKQ